VPAVLAVVYGGLRLVEASLPAPIARVLLGSASPPGRGSTDLDASDGAVTIGGQTYTGGPSRSRAFPDDSRLHDEAPGPSPSGGPAGGLFVVSEQPGAMDDEPLTL
jgi:hypothetical protein